MNKGYLVVVGTGSAPAGQITVEARAWIERAGRVFHAVQNPAVLSWLIEINPHIQSLIGPESNREQMTARILASLAAAETVCVVLGGHPAVFQETGRFLVDVARAAGYRAWLTPAVSAEDCLFADLGVDPGRKGGQTFTATHFLLYRPVFDPTAHLILWGVDRIGRVESAAGLALLRDRLSDSYPAGQPLFIYQPPPATGRHGASLSYTLETLVDAQPTPETLLYVPPLPSRPADETIRRRLQKLSQEAV